VSKTPPTKTAPPPVTTEWVHVTPALAHSWLGKNLDNRKIRRLKVSAYAHDMKAGKWAITHQGVAFDDQDQLRDGQHRLMAIIEANVPIWMLVARGLDSAAQRHMDRGASRRVSDFMSGTNGAARVSAARYLIALRHLQGVATTAALTRAAREVTDGDLYDLFDKEPGLAEDLEELSTPANRAARVLEGMGPSPLIVAAATFPQVGEEVLDAIHTGAGLSPGSPILALRNYRGPGLSATHIGVHCALRVFQAVTENKTYAKLQVVGIDRPVKIAPR
jgi:hydrogenase maturation factor